MQNNISYNIIILDPCEKGMATFSMNKQIGMIIIVYVSARNKEILWVSGQRVSMLIWQAGVNVHSVCITDYDVV